MKSLTRIVCLFGILSILFSRPVALDEAKAIAQNKFPHKKIEKIISLSDNLYLTTFTNGGFVLTSADDGFPAILGYSKDTPYGNNPAFQSMCDDYSREINKYKSASRSRHPDWNTSEPGALNKSSAAIPPLISSKWNQSPHYNSEFPYFSLPGYTGTRPYVGCVAVVMGQLMNYYEHPQRGFGKRWYYSENIDSTLSAIFDTSWYDYTNMPDSLHDQYGSLIAANHQVKDVSQFLYQCAVSVEMEFLTDGSSSAYEDMMYAMTSYFDYGTEMVQELKSDYSDNDWKQMIVAELNAGRPVPYRGSGDGGGHAFLLDGYETTTNTYYHFNWGWGGALDGWFLLTSLEPEDGYDYTDNQAGVFNIRINSDDLTRYAYTGFEGWQAGWIYSGSNFYSLTGEDDYVYGFSTNGQWLISPKIHIPDDNNATLLVYAAKTGTSTKECKVMLSTSDTTRTSFTTELGRITPGSSWYPYAFSLRSYKNTAVHIGLEYISSSAYVVLDDFSIWTPKVQISVSETIPETPNLLTAYPNPFNPRVTIDYHLQTSGIIDISIYDLRGNKITSLTEGLYESGTYTLNFNASGLPSGIYICTLTVDNKLLETQKLVLVK